MKVKVHDRLTIEFPKTYTMANLPDVIDWIKFNIGKQQINMDNNALKGVSIQDVKYIVEE